MKTFCRLNELPVTNIRLGPLTGGKWIIDFTNSPSREGTKEEIYYIWDEVQKQRKQEREFQK